MPIASLADFQGVAEGEKVDGTKLPKFGPGGIYHEKQVGQLCAVHAMNNLLQGPLFDEWMLQEAARELDQNERRLMGGQDIDLTGNARMDGFFNVQVIRLLLERMGFDLLPLKGESGRSALKDSAKESGYICNRREHWFALRRIGQEWFDLNSCLMTPRHYTNADVQHHINEAMREGYDVFVVRGEFPRCALEDDSSALLEAVQGCGHASQGYSLFAGRGQSLSGGGAGAAPSGQMSQAEMRAARLARLAGGGASTVPTVEAPPAQPTTAAEQPADAPAAMESAPASRSPALQQLLDMGFEEVKCVAALEAANGNPEAAMDFLLS